MYLYTVDFNNRKNVNGYKVNLATKNNQTMSLVSVGLQTAHTGQLEY